MTSYAFFGFILVVIKFRIVVYLLIDLYFKHFQQFKLTIFYITIHAHLWQNLLYLYAFVYIFLLMNL